MHEFLLKEYNTIYFAVDVSLYLIITSPEGQARFIPKLRNTRNVGSNTLNSFKYQAKTFSIGFYAVPVNIMYNLLK